MAPLSQLVHIVDKKAVSGFPNSALRLEPYYRRPYSYPSFGSRLTEKKKLSRCHTMADIHCRRAEMWLPSLARQLRSGREAAIPDWGIVTSSVATFLLGRIVTGLKTSWQQNKAEISAYSQRHKRLPLLQKTHKEPVAGCAIPHVERENAPAASLAVLQPATASPGWSVASKRARQWD